MVGRKHKGATMNKLLIALLALTLLSGCGQNEPAAEAPAAPQASDTEAAAVSAAPPTDPVIDYVWNSTVEGMTDEQLMDIAARWNARRAVPYLTAILEMPRFSCSTDVGTF